MSNSSSDLPRRRFLKTGLASLAGLAAGMGSVSKAWADASPWDRTRAEAALPATLRGRRILTLTDDGGRYRIQRDFADRRLADRYGQDRIRFSPMHVEREHLLPLAPALARADEGPVTPRQAKQAIAQGSALTLAIPGAATVGRLDEHLRAERLLRKARPGNYNGPLCAYDLEADGDLAEATGPINVAWGPNVRPGITAATSIEAFMSDSARPAPHRWPGKSSITSFVERVVSKLGETGDRYVLPDDGGSCPASTQLRGRALPQTANIAKPIRRDRPILPDSPAQYHIRAYTVDAAQTGGFAVIGQAHYDRLEHGKASPVLPVDWKFRDARAEVHRDWVAYTLDDGGSVTVQTESMPSRLREDVFNEHDYDARLTTITRA